VGRKTSKKRGNDELSRPEKRSIGNRPPLPRPVDAIAEDDEEPSPTLVSPTSGRVLPAKRADASQPDMTGRTRAISTSQLQTGAPSVLARKNSSLSAKSSIPISQKRSVVGPSPLELSDKPNRIRKIQRDLSDMDPDDIMNGSDDEKSESRAPSSFRSPRPLKISKSARELIDFLDAGPPVDFAPPLPPPSPTVSSLKSTGRFQRMMSRLTGSSSSERLREEGARLRKGSVSHIPLQATRGITNPPQTPVKQLPAVIVATPPPRLHLQTLTQQITPPSSPPSVNQDPPRPMQRKTSVRKKVPPLDPELDISGLGPPSTPISRTVTDEHPPPSPLTNGGGRPNGVNGIHKSSSPPSSSPEPELRTRESGDTIASDDQIMFRRPAPAPSINVEVEAVAPAPPPVIIRPSSPPSPPSQYIELSLNATHAQSLRQLMSTATTADECRVLVDMFLARVGFPIDRSTDMDPYPSPISSTDPSDVDLESSVIETLLGGGSSGPSTATHSVQPSEVGHADESEAGTSDADTYDEDVDSPIHHTLSMLARINPPLPPTSRPLAVA